MFLSRLVTQLNESEPLTRLPMQPLKCLGIFAKMSTPQLPNDEPSVSKIAFQKQVI